MNNKHFFNFAVFVFVFSIAFFYFEKSNKVVYQKITQDPLLVQENIPNILFINETDSHKYDRSLKLSIKMAQKRSGIQNAIILLKQFPNSDTIEDLAVKYVQQYRIGEKFGGKGLLFLYSEKDKQLKIEVTYDLEGIFPDIVCHRLELGARTFMLTGNSRDFLTELLVTMNIYYLKYNEKSDMKLEFPYASNAFSLSNFLSGGAGVVGRNYSDAISARKLEIISLNQNERKEFSPGLTAEESLKVYLHSLEAGVGDELLPVLTDGSQVYRMENPKSPGYLHRQMTYYKDAMPYQLITQDEKAVAMFKAGNPVLPIFLRKSKEGLWYVDESRMWAENHLYEDANDPVQKYENSPMRFAWLSVSHPQLNNIIYKNHAHSITEISYSGDFQKRVLELEDLVKKQPTAENYFRFGDFLYFNTYWLAAAISLIEKGLALDPSHDEYRWRLIDLYMNNSDIEPMLSQYQILSKKNPEDTTLKESYDFYRKAFEYTDDEIGQLPQVSQTVTETKYTKETSFIVTQTPSQWPPKKYYEFPDFEFKDIHGNKHHLTELKGKWVLVEPIGMNCPACLAFSGAHHVGTLSGISPQNGLLSIEEYLTQGKIDIHDERIQLVQLLLYDLNMKGPQFEEATLWRNKFDIGKNDHHWVISGGNIMQNQASFDMIPGYYLLDTNGYVISDSTGHNPKDNLFSQLIPLLNQKLNSKRLVASEASKTAKTPEQLIQILGLTPEAAYKMIPHERTVFAIKDSPLDLDIKADLDLLLRTADVTVALRVKLMTEFNAGNMNSPIISIYDEILNIIQTVNNSKIDQFKQTLITAILEQKSFFMDWKVDTAKVKNLQSNKHVQSASAKLHSAYSILLSLSPQDTPQNKQAFYNYLCALDFL
jgi:hypothetical protein